MYQITPRNFRGWLQTSIFDHRPTTTTTTYRILLVHSRECPPCRKAYPIFKKLAAEYDRPSSRFVFAEYLLPYSEELKTPECADHHTLLNSLDIRKTPTIQVYAIEALSADLWTNEKIATLTGANSAYDLRQLIERLGPYAPQTPDLWEC